MATAPEKTKKSEPDSYFGKLPEALQREICTYLTFVETARIGYLYDRKLSEVNRLTHKYKPDKKSRDVNPIDVYSSFTTRYDHMDVKLPGGASSISILTRPDRSNIIEQCKGMSISGPYLFDSDFDDFPDMNELIEKKKPIDKIQTKIQVGYHKFSKGGWVDSKKSTETVDLPVRSIRADESVSSEIVNLFQSAKTWMLTDSGKSESTTEYFSLISEKLALLEHIHELEYSNYEDNGSERIIVPENIGSIVTGSPGIFKIDHTLDSFTAKGTDSLPDQPFDTRRLEFDIEDGGDYDLREIKSLETFEVYCSEETEVEFKVPESLVELKLFGEYDDFKISKNNIHTLLIEKFKELPDLKMFPKLRYLTLDRISKNMKIPALDELIITGWSDNNVLPVLNCKILTSYGPLYISERRLKKSKVGLISTFQLTTYPDKPHK